MAGRPHTEVNIAPEDKLLTPAELGKIMRIKPTQIARWALQGKIRYTRTLGGHRRYYLSDVIAWQRGEIPPGWHMTEHPNLGKQKIAEKKDQA